MKSDVSSPVLGVVLAGGLGRRMGGGDKPLRVLAGRVILDRVVERFAPQCDVLVLNANGDPARFASYKLPVIADGVEGFAGPLAGILAGLEHAAERFPGAETVATVPGDCPFLPRDLVARLEEARVREYADIAIAASGGRHHPVVGLWPASLKADLRRALVEEDVRKVERFASRYRVATVAWPAEPLDPFFNVNTPDDLIEAERLVSLLED